jgi:hypothetical protein
MRKILPNPGKRSVPESRYRDLTRLQGENLGLSLKPSLHSAVKHHIPVFSILYTTTSSGDPFG